MIQISTKSIFKSLVFGSTFLIASYSVNAQISLPTMGAPYTQDFNTLANTGTGTNTLALTGWAMVEAPGNAFYSAGTGSSGTGDTYSFGAAASSERALGTLRSGSVTTTIGASFTNNTGGDITGLDISYVGEQWRLGTRNRFDSLKFQYSLNATAVNDGLAAWTSVNALDFFSPDTVAPVGVRDGDLAQFKVALSATIGSITIANGSTFYIRWVDINAAGADDGLAVDDFSLTPTGVVTPSLSIADVTMNEGNAGFTSFDFVVSLSVPAGVGGVGFELTSADMTAIAPGDYMTIPTTFGAIPQGMTSYTLSVPVAGDVSIELDETFAINVTNVTGATVADAMAIGTILNDDYVVPVVTLDPSDVNICHGSTANFFAAATGNPAPTVQWQVTTNGGINWTDLPGETFTNLQFTAQIANNFSVYRAIFSNGGGADTTLVATLVVHPNYYINQPVSVCPGSDYTFPDGFIATNITAQVIHVSNFTTVALGCDSIITTTVDVGAVYNINETATVCNGDDYTYPDGVVANNVTGTVSHTSNMTTLLGCDSIINTTVNVSPMDTTTATPASICMGDSALFYGNYITTAGMHYHTLTNMFGCDSVIEIDLTVFSLPTATYSSVVNAGTVDFTGTHTGAIGFQWSFGDGNTSPLQSPSHTYAANGVYTACFSVVSSNGCYDSVCSPVTITSISLKELSSTTSIALYPNPAKENVTIAFATEVKTGSVKLINAIGQVVLTKEVKNASSAEINLNAINKGVYFVQIENNGEKTVKRLIIE